MSSNKNIKLVIIDYGLGNLFSVKQACESLGFHPIVSNNPEELKDADAAILPGVGAFKAAMENLIESGMKEAIIDFVATQKPFMGVCLGLQLLFEKSEEFEHCEGLGLVKGVVKKLPADKTKNIKVPQIGWNTICAPDGKNWENTPLKNTDTQAFMYFVHSYYVLPTEEADILTQTTYHQLEYCSAVQKGNIFATQFHPEKSGQKGIEIYKNWFKQLEIKNK